MALSEANENKIVKILKITPLALETQILVLGSRLTAQVQADVEAEIARWDAGAGAKFTNIVGSDRYPVKIDPDDEKNDIRSNIASLLDRPDWVSSAGGATMRLYRG